MDSSRLDTQARLRSAIAGWRAEVGAAQETLTSQIAQTNTQLQRLVNELANRNDCALALAAAQNDLRRLRRLLPEGAEKAAESGGVFTPLEVMRQELLDGFERYRAAVTAWTTEVTGAHQGLSDQIALANGQFAVLLARLDGRGEEDTDEHDRPGTAPEPEGTGAQEARGQGCPRSDDEWQDCLPQPEEEKSEGEERGLECPRSAGAVETERDHYRDLLAHVEGQRDAHFRTLQTMGQRCAFLEEEVARLHASLQERALARRPLLALGETLERLQRLCETRRAGALIAPVEEAVQRLRVEMAARGVAGAALTQAQQECEILRAQAGLLEHELEDARRQAERLREEREVLQRDATERELSERERDVLRDTLEAVRGENTTLARALAGASHHGEELEAALYDREALLQRLQARAPEWAERTRQLERQTQQIEQLEAQRRAELRDREEGLRRATERAEAAEHHVASLEGELDQRSREALALEQRAQSLTSLLLASTSASESLQQTLTEQERALEQSEDNRSELESALATLGVRQGVLLEQLQGQALAAYGWMEAFETAQHEDRERKALLQLCLTQREDQLQLQAEQIAALKRTEFMQEELLAQRMVALEEQAGEIERLRDVLEEARARAGAAEGTLREALESHAAAAEAYEHRVAVLGEAFDATETARGALADERETLAAQLAQANDQLCASEQEAEGLRRQLAALEHARISESGTLRAAIAALESERDTGRDQAEELRRNLLEARARSTAAEQEQEALYARLAEAHAALHTHEQATAAQQETIERLSRDLETQQSSWTQVRLDIEAERESARNLLTEAEARAEQLEAALGALQSERDGLLHTVQVAEAAQSELHSRVAALQREQAVMLQREEAFEADLRAKDAAINALRMDQHALEESLSITHTQLEEERRRVQGLRGEIEIWSARAEGLAGERDAFMKGLEQVRAERAQEAATHAAAVEQLQREVEEERAVARRLEAEGTARTSQLEAQCAELRATTDSATAQAQRREVELVEMQRAHAALQPQLQDLETQLASSARLLETQGRELREAEQREIAQRAALEEHQEFVRQLKRELSEQITAVASLNARSGHLENALASLRLETEREKSEAAEARNLLESRKEVLAERNSTISLLQREHRELEKYFQEIQAQVSTYRTEVRQAMQQVGQAVRERDEIAAELRRLRERGAPPTRGVFRARPADIATPHVQEILVSSLLQGEHRQRLGMLLKNSGLIGEDQLRHALEEQAKAPGQLLGSVLMHLNYATEDAIAQAIACQLEIPLVQPRKTSIEPAAVRLLDRDVCLWHVCVPLRATEEQLAVAMANPLDETALRKIRDLSRRKVAPCVATPSGILAAIESNYGGAE